MLTNEILEEIQKFREDHAKAFNYDVAAMFDDWRKRQVASGRKAVTLEPKKSNKSLRQIASYNADESISILPN